MKISKKLFRQFQEALIYEEKALIEFQIGCLKELPDSLNEREFKMAKTILDTIIIQSLNHINILSDIIVEYYEQASKKL